MGADMSRTSPVESVLDERTFPVWVELHVDDEVLASNTQRWSEAGRWWSGWQRWQRNGGTALFPISRDFFAVCGVGRHHVSFDSCGT